MEEKIKCAHCDITLGGCSCSWKSTSDKKAVHERCLGKYEKILEIIKNKKEESEQKKREE